MSEINCNSAESTIGIERRNKGPLKSIVRSNYHGAIVIDASGKIVWCGNRCDLPPIYTQLPESDYGARLILPGFVDPHIHFPQYRMIASHGESLLDWLNRYTFPEELAYENPDFAEVAADRFLDHLTRAGTTSCLAFATTHPESVDALFRAAQSRNMSLATGKTLMDRGAPAGLLDRSDDYIGDCINLIKEWHGRDRLKYAISPRFAVTSTDSQLEACGELIHSFPNLLIQTHLSESLGEVARVRQLFPWAIDYTDVYDKFGLITERSLFAHGIHLSEREKGVLAERQAAIVHCPTSNTFLGSGLFRWRETAENHAIKIGLATDIGAGTSYSMLQTMREAYCISQLLHNRLSVAELFGAATIGNATLLGWESNIGTIEPGKFADLVVIDPLATELLRDRAPLSSDITDQLFALLILGDDRVISETFIAGKPRKTSQ
ncbi:guanine deaminase [Pirellulaceae bacterium SH449]